MSPHGVVGGFAGSTGSAGSGDVAGDKYEGQFKEVIM